MTALADLEERCPKDPGAFTGRFRHRSAMLGP